MMNRLGLILAGIYFILIGILFVNELYVRLYDRGNSAMAGLGTYLLSSPSSFLIDWLSSSLFGLGVGSSDKAFMSILGLSIMMNSLLIYLIVVIAGKILRSFGLMQ